MPRSPWIRSGVRLVFAIVVLGGLSSCGPSGPHDLAEEISGLGVPGDAPVLEHREQWNRFLGDGYAVVTLQLTGEQFDRMALDAARAGYRRFHPDNPPTRGLFVADTVAGGWYRSVRKPGPRIEATILDRERHRLLVRLTIL